MSASSLLLELIDRFNVDRNPLVSIVLPMYNAERHICCAIKSIMNQSYSHWELILVDDGSTVHRQHFTNHRWPEKFFPTLIVD